jgi:hypothetical protein
MTDPFSEMGLHAGFESQREDKENLASSGM